MAKYIVDLQEIYEDKSDIDEYLITTDSRAITNTFTRKPNAENDARVNLTPGEKLNTSMEKIDRVLLQLKPGAFYKTLKNMNATIESDEQTFSAKAIRGFYNSHLKTAIDLNNMAQGFGWKLGDTSLDISPGPLKEISNAMLKTTANGKKLEWVPLSSTTVGKSNKLSVYDKNNNDSANFTANVKNDESTPEYLYGSAAATPYKAAPYAIKNISVNSADNADKSDYLNIWSPNQRGRERDTMFAVVLDPHTDNDIIDEGIMRADNFVQIQTTGHRHELIENAQTACYLYSDGILGKNVLCFSTKVNEDKGRDNAPLAPPYILGSTNGNKYQPFQQSNLKVGYAINAGNAATVGDYYTVEADVPANAVFTDTNTWRDVVDSLSSTATDMSLSARQGNVLNAKFNNYLPLAGGSITGDLTLHKNLLPSTSDNGSLGSLMNFFNGVCASFAYHKNIFSLDSSHGYIGSTDKYFGTGFISKLRADIISKLDGSGNVDLKINDDNIQVIENLSTSVNGNHTFKKDEVISIKPDKIESYTESYSYETSIDDDDFHHASDSDWILNFRIGSSGVTCGSKGSALLVKSTQITSKPDASGNIYFSDGIADLSNRSTCDRAVITCYAAPPYADVAMICTPFVKYSSTTKSYSWGCHIRCADTDSSSAAWTNASITVYVKYMRL